MMKFIFVFLFILTFSSILKAQNCSDIKNGIFRIKSDEVNPNETILTRKKDIQIEEVKSKGIKLQYHIKWTSNCTYELSHPKVLKGDFPWASDEQVLYIKITKVTATFYSTEITSNFSDRKMVKDIFIVK